MSTTLDIMRLPEAKDTLKALLDAADEIILTDGDVPVARIVPLAKSSRKHLTGLHRGAMTMHEDFDAPLPDSFWLGQE